MNLALLATVLVAACSPGGTNNVGSHSPVAGAKTPTAGTTPVPTVAPGVTAYGVLVGSQASSTYAVSIIAADGKIVATATASTPTRPSCGPSAAAFTPLPVSTSDYGAYYMNDQGVVKGLGPKGPAAMDLTTVPPPTSGRRSMFAVSPDEHRVAVVVADFSASGASTRLYVEDPGGANHVDIFTETGAYTLWPIGWHGANNLVVAKVAACANAGGPFCCGPLELHVVDPATANRRFTLGGGGCVVVGPPSPGGVVCEDTAFTEAHEVNWVGYWFNSFNVAGATPAMISPNGKLVALTYPDRMIVVPGSVNVSMLACGWIDDSHLLAGGDAQHQPRVGNASTGDIVPVAAQGDCGGRIPGSL